MAKPQPGLSKFFKTFASEFSDEQLHKFITDGERIMRKPAALLLAQAGLDTSTSQPFALLDHGCGTGPIAAHLQATIDKQVLSQSKLLCADLSSNMVGILKKRAEKHDWVNIETAVLDAQNSGLPDESFSHITLSFALHIIPDPGAALRDAMRLLKPGGTLAFTVWHKDNKGWIPDMRSSFEALPFQAPMPAEISMAPNGKVELIDPELIPQQLVNHGFRDVEVHTMEHIVQMEGAEDYLRTFGMMKNWMLDSYWDEESKAKAKDMLDDHIVRHLTEKYHGQGWELPWMLVMIAFILEELQIPYLINFVASEDVKKKSSIYINLFGSMLSLQDPNTFIALHEPGAIISHLIEKYDTTNRLSYSEFGLKNFLRQWFYLHMTLQGPYYGATASFRFEQPERFSPAIDLHIQKVKEVLGMLDRHLKGRNWLVGERMTYADMVWVPWHEQIHHVLGSSYKDKLKDFPNVEAWHGRMISRPSWENCIRFRVNTMNPNGLDCNGTSTEA
ncbi:S-adenosyl-L-methionine-dependent methyltransferase [Nemania sp. FL0916]|nr:S-adenosyl-L-methionine-dependent methyltransferase [Nemania sp. FL0916]